MKPSLVAVPALTGLVATALAAPAGTIRIAYGPEEGSRWSRTIETSTEMAFDELSVSMDGREIDPQFLPEIEMDSTDTVYLEVIDELRKVGDGQPRLLHRTYQEAWREADMTMEMVGMMPEPITSDGRGNSPLEGRTVAFSWPSSSEGEGDEVTRSWVEEDGDSSRDAVLAKVEADLDLIAWLPEGEIEEGDSWSVPAQALTGLLSLADDLSIELEGEGVEEFERGEDAEAEYDGELSLRLAGLREDDGQRVAVIEVTGEFDTSRSYEGDLAQVPMVDGTATVTDTVEHELGGELVWDLAAGLLVSFEGQVDMIIESHTVKDPGQEGPDYESTATLSGTTTIVIAVEPAD